MRKKSESIQHWIQASVLLGVVGYLLVDSGLISWKLISFQNPKVEDASTPVDRMPNDPEALNEYAAAIGENLKSIDTEFDERKREVENVRKLLTHYRDSVRKDHKALEEVKKEIAHLVMLKRKVASKLGVDLPAPKQVATPEHISPLFQVLSKEFAGIPLTERRWAQKIHIGFSAEVNFTADTMELTEACREQLSSIVEVALGHGVNTVRVAHTSLEVGSKDRAEKVKAYLETEFAARIEIRVLDVGSVIRRSRVKDVELWLEEPTNYVRNYQVSDL